MPLASTFCSKYLRFSCIFSYNYNTKMPKVRPQVFNDVFQQAISQAKQKGPALTHNQQVARLYRNGLKLLNSWAIDRDIFNEEATKLRERFDAERGCNPGKASRLLREGEDELFEYTHPDPYRNPVMPGGSRFMRNPPLPMDVCFPDGNYPKDAPNYEINPDWSKATPETGKAATGYVLVDFGKKNME